MIRSKRRGVTLIELMTSLSLTILVLVGAIGLFLFGLQSWLRGQARIDANGTSEHAVRNIANELRETMSVTVDANGQGLTFRRPSVDASGAYVQPPVWDGVARRIYLDASNNIQESAAGVNIHRICSNILTTDPLTNAAYKIFTPGTGSITRTVTVMVVTQRSDYRKESVTSRSRETCYLRNVPLITQ